MYKMKNQEYRAFEDIKHMDKNGIEYWYARELQVALDYAKWDKFTNVIDKAITALKGGKIDWLPNMENPKNINVEDWIVEIEKSIITGKGKKEIIKESLFV